MINAVGYTDDGEVWIQIVIAIDNQTMTGTLTMKPEQAKAIAADLNTACEKADTMKAVREVKENVRERPDLN